ncbi:MAG: 30S ribosomal protein S18 [Gemmatimonadota bacterium]|nr:30S ribosomal protein S18 [Gemmatimonadota bacterium]
MRAYEVVYILDSALEREAVDAKLEAFHDVLGGEITAVDHWGVRQLAYPIRKSKTGYYVIVHVDADPAALPEFERVVKLDEETTRYLIVVNEGQPTTGASVLADRPAAPEPEDEGGDAGAAGGDEGGDAASTGEAEGDQPATEPQPTGPPEFAGARGRRRRHEGPPIVLLNYKDVTTLARFLTEQGKILPKRTTKVSARFQRRLGIAIKRARHIALLPYIRDHEA